MVKGVVGKCETLTDGSVKLSVYVNREDMAMAFPLAYESVFIDLAKGTREEEPEDSPLDMVIEAIKPIIQSQLNIARQDGIVEGKESQEPKYTEGFRDGTLKEKERHDEPGPGE